MNKWDDQLISILAIGTGLEVRSTTSQAFYGRSFEVQLSENSFMYLEERRNINEHLIGYRLAFCFVSEDLPEKLDDDRKGDIISFFKEHLNNNSKLDIISRIGSPYVRSLDGMESSVDKRLQIEKKCLWVDVNSHFDRPEDFSSYIPKFKEICENYSYLPQ